MNAERIRRLAELGFSRRDIREVTGAMYPYIDQALNIQRKRDIEDENTRKVRYTAERLLRGRMPYWWHKSREEWEKCVRANFADVLLDTPK